MKAAKPLFAAIALSVGLLSATGANAALIAADGGQTVYDDDLNIYWLANANLAASNSFGLVRNVDLGGIPGVNTYGGSYIYNDGRMTWGGAMKWVAAMNTANYLGYNDWRLPTVTDTGTPGCDFSYGGTECGWNVNTTTGEVAHLFFDELGNKSSYDISGKRQTGWGLTNTGLFTNFQSNYYRSGTEYAPYPGYAWDFNTYNGYQSADFKDSNMFALAVRPGQVAAAPTVAVPEPATTWLLGLGLLGLAGVAKKWGQTRFGAMT